MKKFWNYIFYFTWKLYKAIAKNIFEKLLDYLFGLSAFWDKHNKNGKRAYENIINNPEIGFNVGFAYRSMLVTTIIFFATIELYIFYSLDTGLKQIFLFLFGIDLNGDINTISFFVSILVFSWLWNEFFLGWHKDKYLKYFKEFELAKQSYMDYLITISFHLSAWFVFILAVIYFNV